MQVAPGGRHTDLRCAVKCGFEPNDDMCSASEVSPLRLQLLLSWVFPAFVPSCGSLRSLVWKQRCSCWCSEGFVQERPRKELVELRMIAVAPSVFLCEEKLRASAWLL